MTVACEIFCGAAYKNIEGLPYYYKGKGPQTDYCKGPPTILKGIIADGPA